MITAKQEADDKAGITAKSDEEETKTMTGFGSSNERKK